MGHNLQRCAIAFTQGHPFDIHSKSLTWVVSLVQLVGRFVARRLC